MNFRYLEWYVKYLWPLHRIVARGLSKRCTLCLVSEKYASFDQNGVCAECRKVKQPTDSYSACPDHLYKKFDDVIKSYISKGKRYDAALLLSGGKDSAYMLHKMHITYPDLHILCITVDNGFMSPVALVNARYIADRLGYDLIVLHSARGQFKKTLREAFLNIKGSDAYKVVDFADGSLIFEIGKKTAANFSIPCILAGLSWVQLQHIAGLVDAFEIVEENGPPVIFPLAVWRPDEQDIRNYVTTHGLIPPGNDSPLVSNSDLVLPMCVVDILNLGYCSFEPEFAQLIREKKTDRRLWLGIFELMEYGVKTKKLTKEANKVLKRLDLKIEDIVENTL